MLNGDGTWVKVPGIGEPASSTVYRPAGRNSAAIHTTTVTMARVVTALGKLKPRFSGAAFASCVMRADRARQ